MFLNRYFESKPNNIDEEKMRWIVKVRKTDGIKFILGSHSNGDGHGNKNNKRQ